MSLFHGLSAFPITPADQHGTVNTEELCRLLERLDDAKVDSVGLLGSTGGYAYLSREQRNRAVEAANQCLEKRVPLIASVGAIRTDEAQALARDAQTHGADGLLMAPVSYTPLTQEEAFQHYVAVAGETDLELCIYNNPSTTHFTFSAELLQQLSEVPKITAVKMPIPGDGDHAGELAQLRPMMADNFSIGYSGDWECASGMLAGADGWYSVVGGLFPVETMKLARASQAGDADEVKRLDAFFQPMWELFQAFGSLRVIYAAANILSLTNAQPHRPLLPVPQSEHGRIKAAIEKLVELA